MKTGYLTLTVEEAAYLEHVLDHAVPKLCPSGTVTVDKSHALYLKVRALERRLQE